MYKVNKVLTIAFTNDILDTREFFNEEDAKKFIEEENSKDNKTIKWVLAQD